MDLSYIEKMSRASFDEKFEIIFSEEQAINSGTSKVLSGQRQALLKNKNSGEIFQTNIFVSNIELGELLVIEKYCLIQ